MVTVLPPSAERLGRAAAEGGGEEGRAVPLPGSAGQAAHISVGDSDGGGRLLPMPTAYESASDLADGLRRASEAHDEHEQRAGEADHDWPDWHALYMARERPGEELPT